MAGLSLAGSMTLFSIDEPVEAPVRAIPVPNPPPMVGWLSVLPVTSVPGASVARIVPLRM